MSEQAEAVPSHAEADEAQPINISIRDVDVPFIALVGFFCKAVIAAIPAMMLLAFLNWIVSAMFGK